MTAITTYGRRLAATLAVMGMVAVYGCGDDTGLAKRYPVSGTVTYNGKPVEKGSITFNPTDPDGRPATGPIRDGNYTLTTARENDGALPGTYKVTVVSKEGDDSKVKAIAKGGPAHHDAAFAESVKKAKSMVPPKYSIPDTSGITKEVKAATNTIPIELTD